MPWSVCDVRLLRIGRLLNVAGEASTRMGPLSTADLSVEGPELLERRPRQWWSERSPAAQPVGRYPELAVFAGVAAGQYLPS